ncbi:hypothetical protein TNCV_1077531 [Trichonephila clavipes]|uniref:Uncharacterized protein n=1 Tax=Trichonephila clavipes TaxID=2585209 RepID=A0A8X6V746_TRICX|nr:hypothetical protein TNCV_1077531 [Trichonephila clavipes]
MPRRRIPAHYEQLSEKSYHWIERGRLGKSQNCSSYGSKRPLEDSGKNGWTMADFSVMMVVVDLGPRQIRRTD